MSRTNLRYLVLFASIFFSVVGHAEGPIEKDRVISVSVLLDPSSRLYGKTVVVFGYFKLLGAEGGIQYGRLCSDRESAEKNYRPNCLVVEMEMRMSRLAKSADGKFSQIEATPEVENILTTHPGKLTRVTRISSYSVK